MSCKATFLFVSEFLTNLWSLNSRQALSTPTQRRCRDMAALKQNLYEKDNFWGAAMFASTKFRSCRFTSAASCRLNNISHRISWRGYILVIPAPYYFYSNTRVALHDLLLKVAVISLLLGFACSLSFGWNKLINHGYWYMYYYWQ